jgi:hypothetical protein
MSDGMQMFLLIILWLLIKTLFSLSLSLSRIIIIMRKGEDENSFSHGARAAREKRKERKKFLFFAKRKMKNLFLPVESSLLARTLNLSRFHNSVYYTFDY